MVLRAAVSGHRRDQIDRGEVSGSRGFYDSLGREIAPRGVQRTAQVVRQRCHAGVQPRLSKDTDEGSFAKPRGKSGNQLGAAPPHLTFLASWHLISADEMSAARSPEDCICARCSRSAAPKTFSRRQRDAIAK